MKAIIKEADAQTLGMLQRIDVDAFARMNDDIARAIIAGLTDIVMIGGNVQDAVVLVAEKAGKLAQYSQTWINRSRSMLSQKITDITATHLVEGGKNPYFEYSGNLDDKTRDACLEGLGATPSSSYPNAPYFTPDEREQFEAEYGIRWNCRHEFVLVTESHYEDMVGKESETFVGYDHADFDKYKDLSLSDWNANVKNLSIDIQAVLRKNGFETSINHSTTFMGNSSYLDFSSKGKMVFKKWKHPQSIMATPNELPKNINVGAISNLNRKFGYSVKLEEDIMKAYNLKNASDITRTQIIEVLKNRGTKKIWYESYTYEAEEFISSNIRISNHSVGTRRMFDHIHIHAHKDIIRNLDKIFIEYKELLDG